MKLNLSRVDQFPSDIDGRNTIIVLNLGKGTYIKEKDILLGQLVAAVMRYPDPGLGLVVEMILNFF